MRLMSVEVNFEILSFFVFYMNYRLFQYHDHGIGYSMFHSTVMKISNSQLYTKLYIPSYDQLKDQVNGKNVKECPENKIYLCN